MKRNILIHSLEELEQFAKGFAEEIQAEPFCVVTLTGDLAAGKTTFTQFVAKYLGVKDHVQSPTYALLRSYTIPAEAEYLHHLDLYRVEDSESIESYGIIDLLQARKGLFFIEWPEVIKPIFRDLKITEIAITISLENASRFINIEK
ncbi:MAG: tRNA (adenosine(37)-N6)-threonylcarbamoyltransferase complex ATPase subunit type 1 TsaE [Candidatus Gracilibacteria bacterium]